VLPSLSWEFLHDGLCLEGAWWRFVHLLPWSECFDYRSCFVALIFLFHGSLHDAWAVFPLCLLFLWSFCSRPRKVSDKSTRRNIFTIISLCSFHKDNVAERWILVLGSKKCLF
jgi:hypothetical protein